MDLNIFDDSSGLEDSFEFSLVPCTAAPAMTSDRHRQLGSVDQRTTDDLSSGNGKADFPFDGTRSSMESSDEALLTPPQLSLGTGSEIISGKSQ